jgi:hypothetical protein
MLLLFVSASFSRNTMDASSSLIQRGEEEASIVVLLKEADTKRRRSFHGVPTKGS